MRVISGQFKGKTLFAPKGQAIRPTADVVKETLFNMLGPQIQAATVLDVFAGTGNVGIEALSRGAAHAVFIEKHPGHVRVLRRNLDACSLTSDAAIVYHGDANKIVPLLHKDGWRFQFVYLDPPYRQTNLLCDMLQRLLDLSLVVDDGVIVVEHAHTFPLPEHPNPRFSLTKHRRVGDTMLSFYTAA
jgi:16S rRNA (guanine966-N2)-methyltransferase